MHTEILVLPKALHPSLSLFLSPPPSPHSKSLSNVKAFRGVVMSTFSGFSSSTKIWDTFLAERIAKSWIRRCWCCSSREDLRHYCWTALGFSCLHYLCKILLLQHCNSKSTKLNPKVKELHFLPDYGMVLLCKLEDILSFYCIYRILLYLSLSRSTWLF